ncbi:piggyBac transposable element-derived protein 4-like [Dendropsophus ebraccatus]|uniref:piggyBac transposable element-derived protein 4-like n=1 Tax=Dendropsophus ebraccatus TaxID=150705 RepID=UPI0038318D95
MARRLFSAEEAYAMVCSDTETASEDGEEFLCSSSSSSSESESPPARRRRLDLPADAGPSESTWVPVGNYTPQIPTFSASPGIQVDTSDFREVDFFKLFFSEDLLAHMVHHTNLYAQQRIDSHPTSYFARVQNWTPTNSVELQKFWGLLLNMGLVKKTGIRDYWSSDILYNTPLNSTVMTRTRFEDILKCLHYNDNSRCPPPQDPSYDRLYKVRPVIDHYATKFSQVYTPSQNVVVDESLVSFKGRLHFRQYLPNKRARYGIKMYKACESSTGYTFRFQIYEGKDSKIEPPNCPPNLKISGKIVWDLIYPILGKGYHLYIDNFYNSVPLLTTLSTQSTLACGTIRRNKKGLPRALLGQNLRKGESSAMCKDNLMFLKFKDKREVLFLSTIHDSSCRPAAVRGSSTPMNKPVCILDYNRFMGGVDLSDQVIKPYSAMRKSKTWYKKLAVHLTQIALYNAFVLSRHAGSRDTFLQFQEKVIKNLIFGDLGEGVASGSNVCRIVPGQHFPLLITPTERKSKPQK